jgi:hypothetical protein
MVRTAGLEPAIASQGVGFKDRCVCQFRHVRTNTLRGAAFAAPLRASWWSSDLRHVASFHKDSLTHTAKRKSNGKNVVFAVFAVFFYCR